MTVMTNRFYAPKGRHIVIKLPVLSDLSVWVFISYPEYISYIILGRNDKFRVLMHLGSWSIPRRYFFCGSFMFLFCFVFALSLCASVYMCFVVTCWERADLLALVCGVYCEFVTFPLVSWVRCGT